MATVLYLDNRQVFPDGFKNIKLTKENPYFTQSDSYTLDVSLPMEIMENRLFFKDINRIERKKENKRMACRLIVDKVELINGTAKITEISEHEVKVQLLGGNSELNLIGDDEDYYIDNLSLGEVYYNSQSSEGITRGHSIGDDSGRPTTETGGSYFITTDIKFRSSAVYDETNALLKVCWQFGLIDITKQIFKVLGFTIQEFDIDHQPWNEIYVATAKATNHVSHVLPHWSIRTFIKEFSNFFNVSIIIDQLKRDVYIKSNPSFFKTKETIEIVPIDEYKADLNSSENNSAIASDNIAFDMSDSEHHDYDVVPESIKGNAQTITFSSLSEAINAWNAADDNGKKNIIYACPTGRYTGWLHDFSDLGGDEHLGEQRLLFTQIDIFGTLTRNAKRESKTDLKICPVAFGGIDASFTQTVGGRTGGRNGGRELTTWENEWIAYVPTLANPTGDEYTPAQLDGSGKTIVYPGSGTVQQVQQENTIQSLITGEAEEKEGKEDRLQVMFIDDVKQKYYLLHKGQNTSTSWPEMNAGFTDFQYKKSHIAGIHNPWSLSLNPCEATHYLGQLHVNGFNFKLDAKYCIKFLSDSIPDPSKIFIIRNKRYGCEKIEANIEQNEMKRLMTGYFYEME